VSWATVHPAAGRLNRQPGADSAPGGDLGGLPGARRARALGAARRLARGVRYGLFGLTGWLAGSSAAHACSVCFGPSDDPMIEGTKLAIAFMLGMTYVVVGGGIALAVLHRRRCRRLMQTPEPPPPRPTRKLAEAVERAA
jgi:hypothetical protein